MKLLNFIWFIADPKQVHTHTYTCALILSNNVIINSDFLLFVFTFSIFNVHLTTLKWNHAIIHTHTNTTKKHTHIYSRYKLLKSDTHTFVSAPTLLILWPTYFHKIYILYITHMYYVWFLFCFFSDILENKKKTQQIENRINPLLFACCMCVCLINDSFTC